MVMGVLLAQSAFASNAVRISQVYGGGGGSTGTYIKDYVELFNNSGSAVNIGGWSLQYGSAAGSSFGSVATNMFVFPAGTMIQPCKYLLVETSAAGTAGTALPVPADFSTTNMSMSATSGKVALINNSTGSNPCAGNTSGGIFVDVVGYGTGNCFETADAPGLTSTGVGVRGGAGTTDTDNNSTDFTALPTSDANAQPRNSASPANQGCLVVPIPSGTWGRLKMLYR